MDDLLLNKQVAGYIKRKGEDKISFDKNVTGVLSIMYPTFNIVNSQFQIFPGEPFIYIGDVKWINTVIDRPEPHIVVATTGEYDLTDRNQLIDLAYAHHNKKKPQYMDELVKSWDEDTFYYNWKYLWVMGEVPEKELIKNNIFFEIVDNFSKPILLTSKYLEAVNSLGEDSTKYLEGMLLSFIENSRNMDSFNSKNMRIFKLRQSFLNSYDKNTNSAIEKLLDSSIDNATLRNLNFILDLVWPNR